MATETTEIVVPNIDSKARIILDWDDGQWYISSISTGDDIEIVDSEIGGKTDIQNTQTNVKVAEWTESYKYSINDIVAYKGNLYVSKQNNNIGNIPEKNEFWWRPLVDLSNVDAKTLEGKNLKEVSDYVLGGHTIDEYYTKSEVENYVLNKINNVDAKKLNGWTLDEIKEDYEEQIKEAKENAINTAINYFKSEDINSYQQELIELFNSEISPDDINQ